MASSRLLPAALPLESAQHGRGPGSGCRRRSRATRSAAAALAAAQRPDRGPLRRPVSSNGSGTRWNGAQTAFQRTGPRTGAGRRAGRRRGGRPARPGCGSCPDRQLVALPRAAVALDGLAERAASPRPRSRPPAARLQRAGPQAGDRARVHGPVAARDEACRKAGHRSSRRSSATMPVTGSIRWPYVPASTCSGHAGRCRAGLAASRPVADRYDRLQAAWPRSCPGRRSGRTAGAGARCGAARAG